MDPVTLALLTSAVSMFAGEYIKGFSGEAGKATWSGIKSVFGWKDDPKLEDVPHRVASSLAAAPELGQKIFVLLKDNQAAGVAASMIGKIDAKNVTNIQTNYGPISMQ